MLFIYAGAWSSRGEAVLKTSPSRSIFIYSLLVVLESPVKMKICVLVWTTVFCLLNATFPLRKETFLILFFPH